MLEQQFSEEYGYTIIIDVVRDYKHRTTCFDEQTNCLTQLKAKQKQR